MQDGTPYGRYRLIEMLSQSEAGQTWRALDTTTQQVVSLLVPADAGSQTMVRATSAPEAGSVVEYPATSGSGYVLEYPAYSPLGSVPTGVPRNEPKQDDPKPLAPKKSRKRRVIALSSAAALAVVVAVVAAVVLTSSGKQSGTAQAPSTSAPPANTGPFTGTFAVKVTAATLGGGKPDTDSEAKAYTDTWTLRSACSTNGCVATATMGNFEVSDMVFDQVGGSWFGVAVSHIECDRPNDEAWNVVSLAPQPDGSLSGEVTRATANGCFTRRTATLTRTGATDITKLPDPTHLDPRTVSPAEALHGSYTAQTTYANGYKPAAYHYGVRTDCLRAGDRCMSFFLTAKGGYEPYVYANGTWTLNEEMNDTCSSGGQHHVIYTATMSLPDPPQNPITSLIGHGFENAPPTPGVNCHSQAYDETITRTGD